MKSEYRLYNDKNTVTYSQYSKCKFGRDSEITIAVYMMSKGWNIKLSKGSKGPADIYASKGSKVWYIQVKASTKVPRIKGADIIKLENLASLSGACPVVAFLQPVLNATTINLIEFSKHMERQQNDRNSITEMQMQIQKFYLSFYDLGNWSRLEP